ncbi:MAG: ADP-ribosylglycohydrolase family protein [Candidatus Azobacteroides sp.]|nr:ADP-ribosylglycohydrolase family protein [Candidatus Azobacteroides sp.]
MKSTIKRYFFLTFSIFFFLTGYAQGHTISLSKETLLDKIKGGWAGKTFGCTFGGPTEFKYVGRIIPDSIVIPWPEHYCLRWFENDGSLYDDVYMNLTFVDMYDKHGFDVSTDVIANAFANAKYKLWHANQAARYNILNGIPAPQSGYWKNNPHADDIDFQIEADFAGLMSPGMPDYASEICDKIGHIVCYGDGWYGGVYVAAMYSLAFVSDDISYVVKEALKTIPEKSQFRQCINDVIGWCEQNPDWKVTWQLLQDKWTNEISCPRGVDDPYTIDAKVNSAYVVMGLLYGAKDMEKTLEISTRCGADSDCNPSTAGGILGTLLGYSNIDAKWINNIKEVEDMNFDHTEISLNKAYKLGFDHALEMIKRGGGEVSGKEVKIVLQKPKPVRLEQGFTNLKLVKKEKYPGISIQEPFSYEFTGAGFVCSGRVRPQKECPDNYVAEIEVNIDGKKEMVKMPSDFITRKLDVYWNYDLPKGDHQVVIKWLNPVPKANVIIDSVITYTNCGELHD